ncbi:MAG: hypothetical protein Q9177_000040 [Variospora cf. flavescens]
MLFCRLSREYLPTFKYRSWSVFVGYQIKRAKMTLWKFLVQSTVFYLSLARLSYATPLNGPIHQGNQLTLSSCSSHGLATPLEQFDFTLLDSHPSILLRVVYCPNLKIHSVEVLRHTLFQALYTFNQCVIYEGYNAPLKQFYKTPEERGYNCKFTIENLPGRQISLGVMLNVLQLMRRWMIGEQRLGSTIHTLSVDGVKTASGILSPIVDPTMIFEG